VVLESNMSTTGSEGTAGGATKAPTTMSMGHGGRSGGRGRGFGRGTRGGRGEGRGPPCPTSNFKGSITKMNGHVFQCFSEGSNKNEFTKTVKVLHEYIAKKLMYPSD
jgi:hypothetical protein